MTVDEGEVNGGLKAPEGRGRLGETIRGLPTFGVRQRLGERFPKSSANQWDDGKIRLAIQERADRADQVRDRLRTQPVDFGKHAFSFVDVLAGGSLSETIIELAAVALGFDQAGGITASVYEELGAPTWEIGQWDLPLAEEILGPDGKGWALVFQVRCNITNQSQRVFGGRQIEPGGSYRVLTYEIFDTGRKKQN